MNYQSVVEPLESRIAPAVVNPLPNPIADITAGIGQTGVTIDLAKIVDANSTHHTFVEFVTNYVMPGTTTPAKIVIELFDDAAPLSVQNFLSYVNGRNGANYDGTFFHRIFDFQSDGQTDIIQAGGFDVTNLTRHIPTGPTVHNEYQEGVPTLQNLPGTIAMAKTATSPHTATSEWFINLTDNSTTLGADNNGGFTVFGIIREGLDVATAIGSAEKISLGGALTDLPVQESYDDGKPRASELIQIVDAKVIAPIPGNAGGHIFNDVKVTEVGSSVTSSLVTAVIDPATKELKVIYTPGATGVAQVTFDIERDGDIVKESFTVTIKPNLITELTTHNLPATFVPGDSGVAKVKLTNNTGGDAVGDVEVRLWLSPVDADGNNQLDPDAFLVNEGDQLLATKTISLKLLSGKSLTVPVNYTVHEGSDDIVLVNGRQYVVVAEVVPVSGGTITEVFSDDNSDARRTGHNGSLGFGNVGDRKNVQLTVDGPSGPMTFTLSGKGTGLVSFDANGNIDLSVSGTDAGSVMSVKSKIADQFIDDVSINSTIGSVKFAAIDLRGHFSATGGAKSIVLGDLGDAAANQDRDFSVNVFPPNPAQKLSLTFGAVNDYSLSSSMHVAKLNATSWQDDAEFTGNNEIFVAGIDVLKIAGNLSANVSIASDVKMKQFIVGGSFQNATLKTLGDISTIKLGSMTSSTILAGISAAPDELSDFALDRTIGTFTVTGAMADSLVAAKHFNSIVLGSVDTAPGTEVKGIYADAIKSYLRKTPVSTKLTKLDAPGTFDATGNYEVQVF